MSMQNDEILCRLDLDLSSCDSSLYVPMKKTDLSSKLLRDFFVTRLLNVPSPNFETDSNTLSDIDFKKIRLAINSMRLVISAHGSQTSKFDRDRKPFFFDRGNCFRIEQRARIKFLGKANHVLYPYQSIFTLPFSYYQEDCYSDGKVPEHLLSGDYVNDDFTASFFSDEKRQVLEEFLEEGVNKGVRKVDANSLFKCGATTSQMLLCMDDFKKNYANTMGLVSKYLFSTLSGSSALNDNQPVRYSYLHIENGSIQLSNLYKELLKKGIKPSEILVYCCRGVSGQKDAPSFNLHASDYFVRNMKYFFSMKPTITQEFQLRSSLYNDVAQFETVGIKDAKINISCEDTLHDVMRQNRPIFLYYLNYKEALFKYLLVNKEYESAIILCEQMFCQFKMNYQQRKLMTGKFAYLADNFLDDGLFNIERDTKKYHDMSVIASRSLAVIRRFWPNHVFKHNSVISIWCFNLLFTISLQYKNNSREIYNKVIPLCSVSDQDISAFHKSLSREAYHIIRRAEPNRGPVEEPPKS